MELAKVIGNVVCTRKAEGFEGIKLLLIQPILPEGSTYGSSLVAADSVDAGWGELVFFVRSKEASFPFLPDQVPCDATIVGVVDAVEK